MAEFRKMDDLVVFTHVFRTGGMAAYEYLKSAGVRVGRPTYESIVSKRRRWEEFDILVTHVPYHIDYFIPGRNVLYVTFLREPHDRIISRYFSGQDPARTWDTMLAKFRTGVVEGPDNMMTRFFRDHSGMGMERGFNNTIVDGNVTWHDLERARFNLENNYLFVGLTEWWEESMAWLCNYFDWPPPDGKHPKDNASRNRPNRELPDDVMEIVYRREIFDAHLYYTARDLANDYLWR